MQQRVSLITLGVIDVGVAKTFYERLGWRVGLDVEETVFFQIDGSVLALWGRDKLAQYSGVTQGGPSGGVALSHNVGSPGEVDASSSRRGRRGPASDASRPQQTSEDTPAFSSIRTAINGKLRTTPRSSSETTAA